MLGTSGNKQVSYTGVNAVPVQSDWRLATARSATIAIGGMGMPIGARC